MESKKITQLATEVAPLLDDLTFIGDPITGQLKKVTLNQIAYIFGAGSAWGTITGTLSNQTDLQAALNLKVPYTGATANVNLGAYSITATSLIKAGGVDTQFLKADGSVDNNTYLTADDLPSTLSLYATTAAASVSGYFKLVTTIDDPDFNTTAVDVSTGAITATDQLISSLISVPNLINGNPGVFNVTTYGNIKKVSGTGQSEFYFKIYKRTAAGVETLVGTSSNTIPVVNSGYAEFFATAIWNDGIFGVTDTIVLKYYATRISGGSNPTYNFQFGGVAPVRTIVPIPTAVIPNIYLEDLADVEDGVASNNDGIYYDSAVSLWKYKSIAEVLGYTPANAATYVPYTGATADVNLGTFFITAGGVYSHNIVATKDGIASGGLAIEQGTGSGVPATGISLISSSGNFFELKTTTGIANTKLANIDLGSLTNNTTRTFTLPDLSGTLALLESTQTFTGAKTFDAAYFNGAEFDNTAYFNKGLWLVKNGVPIVYTALQTTIYSEATSNNVVFRDNVSKAKLVFDNSTQTYTFPASSGTLALTSNLSSYVPYTGATGNVNLGAQTLTTSTLIAQGDSSGTLAGQVFLKKNSSISPISDGFTQLYSTNNFRVVINQKYGAVEKSIILDAALLPDNAGRIYSFPNNSGTIALTSDLSGYQPLLTNPVTGTGTNNYLAKFTTTGSTIGNSLIQDDGTNVSIGYTTNPSLYKLDVNGTARVSGALTSGQGKFWDGTQGLYIGAYTGGSGFGAIYSTGVTPNGANFSLAASVNASILSAPTDGRVALAINSTEYLVVSPIGNVGIGTYDLPAYKLQVIGTANITGAVTFNGALTGTSATFSGNVRINAPTNGTNKLIFGIAATDYYWIEYNDATGNIGYSSKYSHIFYGGAAGTTQILSLANNGAATFSSSVTAGGQLKSFGNQEIVSTTLSSTTTYLYLGTYSAGGYGTYIGGTSNYAGTSNTDLVFGTSTTSTPTERMRIESGGNLLLGTTGNFSQEAISIFAVSVKNSASKWGINMQSDASGAYRAITFYNSAGTSQGYISVSGAGVTTYSVTASDLRLKQNIQIWNENVLNAFSNIKPKTFEFIGYENPETQKGFIAQEMVNNFPEAYPIDEKGYYAFNPSGMVVYLMKAVQELKLEINELKALINK